MKNILTFLAITGSISAFSQESLKIPSSDDVIVYGEYYPAEKAEFVILLFHQAGSNAKAEYGGYIIPELNEHGYSALAVDQRKGGSRLGGENRTAAQVDEEALTYCDAYPDLVATLEYAKQLGKKVVVWGSSYSAALVLRLAVDFPDQIYGVLSFSPASGGPMGDCSANQFIESLTVPAIAFRPGNEAEIESVQKQIELFSANDVKTVIAEKGVHGSSMLNPERAEDIEGTWEQVFNFLSNLE